jgi:hypothetical protein
MDAEIPFAIEVYRGGTGWTFANAPDAEIASSVTIPSAVGIALLH